MDGLVGQCLRSASVAVALVCAAGCELHVPTLPDARFTRISEYGFDVADNAIDRNDYPWGLTQFTPDGADAGYIYATTGNAVLDAIFAGVLDGPGESVGLPPEIRRYRPDLGPMVWERVLDWREIETGPPWRTSGVRGLIAHRARADGRRYLYAGTVSDEPALWRSATGEPGSWAEVWRSPISGSIRCFAEHEGLLYFGLNHELLDPPTPGEIYATDGATVWPIVADGFGSVNNEGVYSLASFNGALYAGTFNANRGFEVWKMASNGGGLADATTAVRIIGGGGTSRAQEAVADLKVFREHLYVGTIVFFNINYGDYTPPRRAADLLRITKGDDVEVVVGPGSVGGVESGFGVITNAFTWTLAEHEGRLYCGTWDGDSVLPVIVDHWPDVQESLNERVGFPLLTGPAPFQSWVEDGWYDLVTGRGARLYVSDDVVCWKQVFDGGLGNPRNYGVRSMLSTDEGLLIGVANVDEGLSLWRFVP